MKFTIFVLLLLFVFENASAARKDTSRTELLSLLQERKILSDEYHASLEKKSGVFGNRTKNDLRDSQEKLVAIVKADNKIMNTLNRTLDFRNYEKQNMTYDVNSFEERIRNLTKLNDTLNKQILIYSGENKMYRKVVKRNQIYFAGLIILLLWAGGVLIKSKISK